MSRLACRPVPVVLALVAALAAACGAGAPVGETSPTPTPATSPPTTASPGTPAPDGAACSAAGMDVSGFTENPDLTGPANETRRAIAQAAVDCDYARLAELAADDFTYSFGDSGDPAAFWRRLEQDGTPVLSILVTLLGLDVYVEEAGAGQDPLTGTLYTWPRAYLGGGTDARLELEQAFGAEVVDGWYGPGGQYLGWRVGIRGDGAWIFYVAGD